MVDEAHGLLQESLVVDACVTRFTFEYDKYCDQMKRGGVRLAAVTVSTHDDFTGAVKKIDQFYGLVKKRSDQGAVTSVAEAERLRDAGKVAVCIYFQNAKMIENDLSLLRALHRMGLRILQLTYNEQNPIGAGCCESRGGGLTYFGQEVVAEMNQLGIVVDLSHCNDATTLEAIAHSKDPVTVSHANARTINNTPRNKSDEIIQALAEKDGVIGVTIFAPCVKLDSRGTIKDVLNHLNYIVNLVGVDHVGLGLDLARKFIDEGFVAEESVIKRWRPIRPDVFGSGRSDKYPDYPVGLESHEDLPNLLQELLGNGFSRQDVKKIVGENFVRVYRRVWRA